VIIAVGSTSSSINGDFAMNVEVEHPPFNATCNGASEVNSGTALYGGTTTYAYTSLAEACLPDAAGGSLFYRVRLPANMVMRATVTPDACDVAVRLLDSCESTTCIASSDSPGTNTPESVTFRNLDVGERSLVLAVSSKVIAEFCQYRLGLEILP
jgi:hypothetical protein